MISKHIIHYKNGTQKTNVRIVEGYRPGPGKAPKQRQIKNLGYAEDYPDQEAFWKMVEEEEKAFRASRDRITIELDPREKIGNGKKYLLGHTYLDAIYDYLEIDRFFDSVVKTKAQYDYKAIFRYLVTQRILFPDSIRAALQRKDIRYGFSGTFDYHHAIRALDLFEQYSEELQEHLNRVITKKIGRKTEYLFYDTTNFYLSKDYAEPGKLGQKGVSKEHVVNPIIQMGLFMDSNKLPVRVKLFPGNTSDCLTYMPMIKEIKERQDTERIVSVADKGMNSSDNVSYIYFNGDGYVFSQILKGKKGTRYHDKMFEEEAFTWNADRTYKYRLFEEDYEYILKDESGKVTRKETAKRKILIYWKKSIADREAKKREIKLEKARKYARNNAYGLTHDASEYVSTIHVDGDTGIVANKAVKSVNTEKASEDAKYDGFFCIVTSELGYGKEKIHEIYGELEHIEESFRICKSEFDLRPVYVSLDEHIRAHVLICFTALLILRLLQLKLGADSPSTERISRSLASFQCDAIAPGICRLGMVFPNAKYKETINENGEKHFSVSFSDEDETFEDLKSIQRAFGQEFTYANVKQEALAKYLKSIKFAIT